MFRNEYIRRLVDVLSASVSRLHWGGVPLSMIKGFVPVLGLIALVCGSALTQPVIKAVIAETAPVIDGSLSDECWKTAPSVADFYYTENGSSALEPTTVWLCYDRKNIYLAWYCKDSQPAKIVAQQKKRGGDIDTDDWVGFNLDCFSKQRHIAWFDVTAGGVQLESLPSGEVSKIEWKGDWNSAVKRADDGYTVEMAVPWSILQYDASQRTMGIAFVRHHARSTQSWWAPNLGPTNDARNFYILDGLQLPAQKTKPMVMGYTLLGLGSENSSERMGLDVKRSLTPSLKGLISVNPDFRNIEQSVDSVDFSYTERYLPDSRPFFLEGSDHFPLSNIFYTRRIENIDVGAKLAGRIGEYGIGAMHTELLGEEHHNLVQFSRQWSDRTWLWVCGIESHTPTVNNNVGYFVMNQRVIGRGDGEILISPVYSVAGSPSHRGHMYGMSMWNNNPPRKIGWNISQKVTEADYNPYLGLVGEKDKRATSLQLELYDYPSEGPISGWYTSLFATKADHLDGSVFYDSIGLSAQTQYRSGRMLYGSINISDRPPNHDSTLDVGYSWGMRDLYGGGGISLSLGRLAGGDYLDWSVFQSFRLSGKLSLQGSYELAQIKDPSPSAFLSRQLIGTLAYELDAEHTLGGRLVNTGGRSNLYLAYKQRLRRGMDAYIIFGDPNADSTRSSVTVKLSKVL